MRKFATITISFDITNYDLDRLTEDDLDECTDLVDDLKDLISETIDQHIATSDIDVLVVSID